MNNVAGSVYTPTKSSTTFTFPCGSVANGTYTSSNDAGLVLEPYALWEASNTAYALYNSFAVLRQQQLNVSGHFGATGAVIGTSPCYAFTNWQGNGAQSIGSVGQISDYSDFYPQNGAFLFIASRLSANDLLAYGNVGEQVKAFYGCYSPDKPLNVLTGAVVNYYGTQGYPVSVASTSGNTITFVSDHRLRNILSGYARLSITGATDTGGPTNSTNGQFYVVSAPTSTTQTVVLAATDFVATGTGGQMNMQDGSTISLSSISATGSANTCSGATSGVFLCGDVATVTTWSQNNYRKRGQTFTLSGVTGSGAASFNFSSSGRTFILLPENLNVSAFPGNSSLFYRELPQLSATGGAASIIPDDNYVKGRSSSLSLEDENPATAFGSTIEAVISRASGERIYKANNYVSGWSDQLGFTGLFSKVQIPVFNGNSLGQLFMHQHFENSATVPIFHAHNHAALIWNRLVKYINQPSLNAPDYGFLMDCAARAGSYGDTMFCLNASDGTQTEAFLLTPYLQSGQNIIRYVANDHSITMSIISAGATTDTLALQPLDAVFYVFPAAFAAELQPAPIAARLADVVNATKIVLRYSYDRYDLDATVGNAYDCGAGACTPPWDSNIGTVYCRLIYLGPSSEVLATSDVQTF